MTLTDDDCNRFRALPLSFNDMVRAIHRAGFSAGLEAGAKECDEHARSCGALGDYSEGRMVGAGVCAKAIRALAAATGEKL